jgi:hypothetical protein
LPPDFLFGGMETCVKPTLASQLEALPKMERKVLQALWLELFGKPPSPAMRREMLVPILNYRLQEKALGGLKASTAKRLRSLAEDLSQGRKLTSSPTTRPKIGTRFVREWEGKLHEVTTLASGYEYDNRTYRSLSEIAREITGTRWSGPAFFGLKSRTKKEAA